MAKPRKNFNMPLLQPEGHHRFINRWAACIRPRNGNDVSLRQAVTCCYKVLPARQSARAALARNRCQKTHMQGDPHILVVDDDRELRQLLANYLRKHGMRVDVAESGAQMHRVLGTMSIDLVVLDRVMPGQDGLELCREIRTMSRVPVILLTLLGSDQDRILGFDVGADDYVQKPFNPEELLARIKAVLRRANELPMRNRLQAQDVLVFEGWVLDRTRRRLTSREGIRVVLTDGEFDLLVAFAEHPQIVLSRDELLDLARGRSAIAFDRAIDMQIARLRRKIEFDPQQPRLIRTVRNKGYIFTPVVTGSAE